MIADHSSNGASKGPLNEESNTKYDVIYYTYQINKKGVVITLEEDKESSDNIKTNPELRKNI